MSGRLANDAEALHYGGTLVQLVSDDGIVIKGVLRSFEDARTSRDKASGAVREQISEALDVYATHLRSITAGQHKPFSVDTCSSEQGNEQHCSGPEQHSPMSGEPPRYWGRDMVAAYVNVYTVSSAHGPLVFLSDGQGPAWCHLTPAGAAALIESLTAALADIDATG